MGTLIQEIFSSIVTLTICALIFAGIYKVFQISTDLGEIKDLLRDIRRNTDESLTPLACARPSQSPEDSLRALSNQS